MATGVIVIVVIAALVLVGGVLLASAFGRARTRRRALERHPDSSGHVGRVSKMRT
jgi:Tfp pilus assembly protein PilN